LQNGTNKEPNTVGVLFSPQARPSSKKLIFEINSEYPNIGNGGDNTIPEEIPGYEMP